MVPRVYTEVQEFILSCLQFSEDLQLTQAELGIVVLIFCHFHISSYFTRRNSKEVNKFVTYKDIVWLFKVKWITRRSMLGFDYTTLNVIGHSENALRNSLRILERWKSDPRMPLGLVQASYTWILAYKMKIECSCSRLVCTEETDEWRLALLGLLWGAKNGSYDYYILFSALSFESQIWVFSN